MKRRLYIIALAATLFSTGCAGHRSTVVTPQHQPQASVAANLHAQGQQDDGPVAALQSAEGESASQGSESFQTSGTFSSRQVSYSIDGVSLMGEVASSEELEGFYGSLMEYAREGHHVVIGDPSQGEGGARRKVVAGQASDDTVTFASANEAEVATWSVCMIRSGYSVSIDYDRRTRIYNCTAYRKRD